MGEGEGGGRGTSPDTKEVTVEVNGLRPYEGTVRYSLHFGYYACAYHLVVFGINGDPGSKTEVCFERGLTYTILVIITYIGYYKCVSREDLLTDLAP